MATENRDQLDRFYDRLQTLPALVGNLGLSIAEAQRRLDQNYIESITAFTKLISSIKSNLPPDALAVAAAANAAVEAAAKLADGAKAANAVADAAKKALGATPSKEATAVSAAANGAIAEASNKPSPEAAQFVAKAASDELAELASANGLSQTQYLELFRAIAPSHYQFTETAVEVRADLRVASASELTGGGEFGINKGIFSATVNFSYLKRSGSDYQASAALRSVINAIPSDHTMLNDLFARAGTPITAAFKSDASFKAVLEALNELKQLPPAKP